ncbi:MAG: ATP-binding protein [Christensenellaceae bacterium]|jgi:hypothetical protein|nr:ATP-binding protein [Christensenellaceae bacterium]
MQWSLATQKRIIAVTGHYGSGKTEFAVSLALWEAGQAERRFARLAVIDLDIANPYFRSRERRGLLEEAGVAVYGGAYREEITAELPALGANAKAPLEDAGCFAIVDLGGNGEGAKVIHQFHSYFEGDQHEVYCVVNANRPDTATVEGALEHIYSIQAATGLRVTGIINNCHLLRETTAQTVLKGHALCEKVQARLQLPIVCDCYPAPLVQARELQGIANPFPLGMYMRETWLDK